MSRRLVPDPNVPLPAEVLAVLQNQLGFCLAALALFADGSDAQRRNPQAAAEVRRGLHHMERCAREYIDAVQKDSAATWENTNGQAPKGRGRA